MVVLGATGGVIWATLEAALACSVIPPGNEFTLFITGACGQGGVILLGTAGLIVVCTGTVGWGKTTGGAEEGGAEKGGAVILGATG